MQISANETSYCKFDFECVIDKEQIDSKLFDVVSKYKDADVSGFRKGKAPLFAVKAHYRKQIDQDLTQELAKEATEAAIAEKNIKLFGSPQYKLIELQNDKFICHFTAYSLPTFELKEYKNFSIPKPAQEMTYEILGQKMIQELRVKNGTAVPYGENDFVQLGDNVILNIKSFDGDVVYDRFTLNGTMLTVGNINIPEFSENIIGMKAGDTRNFESVFPENYPNLSNKTLKFEVELLMGSKSEPAPLDDELAKKVGFNTFDELNQNVMSMASSRIKGLDTQKIFEQISTRLLENHPFDVPEWITNAETEMSAKSSGLEYSKLSDADKNDLTKKAQNNIRLSLILAKVRENEPDCQLTDEEAFSIVKTNIQQFTSDPEKTLQDIINNGHIGMLFARVRDESVLEFIEKNCTIIE